MSRPLSLAAAWNGMLSVEPAPHASLIWVVPSTAGGAVWVAALVVNYLGGSPSHVVLPYSARHSLAMAESAVMAWPR